MKVLVTGGSGFIGSRLLELIKKKYKASNFSKSKAGVKGIESIKGSITDEHAVFKAVKGKDIVVHLAALIDETAGREKLFEVNVNGTMNIVEACRKFKVKQLIYLSSVGVHGKISKEIDENAGLNPETDYEESKAESEKIVADSGLNFTVLRAAMVYGPNEYWKGILKQVKKGFPLIGSGKNTWQMIYVNDIVEAIAFCIDNEKCFKQVFIIAENEKHSLKEVYEMMCKALKVAPKNKFIPYHAGLVLASLLAFTSKIKGKKSLIIPSHVKRLVRERNYSTKKINSLGWKAKIKTFEGIKKTVKALKERKEL